MKTPLSPSPFLESGQIFPHGGVSAMLTGDPSPQQGNQVCKGGVSYSLCQECNVQLTSAAQAQLHYNGRSHLRRLRQIQADATGGGPGPSQPQSPPQGATSTTSTLTPAAAPNSGLNPLLTTPATGSGCLQVGGPLPGLVAGGGASVMMQSSYLSFPVDNNSPVSLFNYNTMDPVQKAVINHTFGVTMATRKKQLISCNVCQLRFNSDSQAEAHYKGSRHAKKLKGHENKTKVKSSLSGGETNSSSSSPVGPAPVASSAVTTNQFTDLSCCVSSPSRAESDPPPSSPPSASPAPAPGLHAFSSSSSSKPPPAAPHPPTSSSSSSCSSSSASLHAVAPTDSEEEKAKKLLYCSLCKVAVNSLSQLDAHNTGSKHKTMMEARSGAGPIKAYPRAGAKLKTITTNGAPVVLKGSGLQNQTFHCQICDVHVNSEIQLKQHISSRRHKDRVAGKPMKPKYSPYNKQRGSTTLTKDLAKPCITPSSILTSPFCPPTSLPSSLPLPLPLPPSTTLSLPPSSFAPSFSLHPRPGSSPLFAPSFLRPAPGPIRATHRPILFAPY